MSEISQELVGRMAALVRGMAEHEPFIMPATHGTAASDDYARAKIIAAELPVPVDPDLIAAREVVCGYHHDKHPESPWHVEQAELVRSGRNDRMLDVQAAYFGIKRGRELAGERP